MEYLEDTEVSFLTEKEIDEIINSVSDDLLFFSIENQIKNKQIDYLEDSNHIQFFVDRYALIKDKYSEYPDIIERVLDIEKTFYSNVLELLEERFDFKLEERYDITREEKYNLIRNIYEFFIMKQTKNSITLVFNYLDREMKSLIPYCKNSIDKKDLTFVNTKKLITKELHPVYCKLNDIISSIQVDEAKDVIELSIDDKNEINNMEIFNYFCERDQITFNDNFIENYLSVIKDSPKLFLLIRSKFIEKYNNSEVTE
ncbi:hypothetical protein Bp8pS_199 [Bacillus phage vB_BpuM-BpSp]|nr:hypothetical protein Bp8pS_199 [Bacillus phage vB_BpuM-BpSp]